MPICRICRVEKEAPLFRMRPETGKYRTECRVCQNKVVLERHYREHERSKQRMRANHARKLEGNPNYYVERYAANIETNKKQSRENYRKHRIEYGKKMAVWAAENRGKSNAYKQAYKQSKRRACPPWVRSDEEQLWLMSEAYELAQLRTTTFSFPWHVDHIIPLRGKLVSGLHTSLNMQVIPGVINNSKSNSFTI